MILATVRNKKLRLFFNIKLSIIECYIVYLYYLLISWARSNRPNIMGNNKSSTETIIIFFMKELIFK